MDIIFCKKCNEPIALYINNDYVFTNSNNNTIITQNNSYYFRFVLCYTCDIYLGNKFCIYCKGCKNTKIDDSDAIVFTSRFINFNKLHKIIEQNNCEKCLHKYLDYKIKFDNTLIHKKSFKNLNKK